MFVDHVEITVSGGKGGDGAKTFRREKYVPDGGPNGGDGGDGGDVIVKVDTGMRTLMDFRYRTHYNAESGENGDRKNQTGKNGNDLILHVPPGTIIKDQRGVILGDLTEKDDVCIVAEGGRGGRGNARFKNSTRRAPNFSEPGYKGEEKTITLELKMIADVGLIGFPNVGKSTFLSKATKAKPKIANYHFTTLKPNLGVVETSYGEGFVLADIPGIIQGASKGIGLGFDFLRHIERTKILIHVVDVSGMEGRDPIKDFEKINNELKSYNEQLANRVQVIAANKTDILYEDEQLEEFKEEMGSRGYEVFPISAATGEGIDALLNRVSQLLNEVEVEPIFDDSELVIEFEEDIRTKIDIYKENNVYYVEGEPIDRIITMTDIDNYESIRRFHNTLKKKGIFKELREMGVKDGDTVNVGGIEFEYIR